MTQSAQASPSPSSSPRRKPPLTTLGHPRLGKVSPPVTPDMLKAPWFLPRLERMARAMEAHGGIGIAAPQIGWFRRVFLMVEDVPLEEASELEEDVPGHLMWLDEAMEEENPEEEGPEEDPGVEEAGQAGEDMAGGNTGEHLAEEIREEEDPQATTQRLVVWINPEVTEFSPALGWAWEGCLSVPGWRGWIRRPLTVTVKGWGLDGRPYSRALAGWNARVFLHEFDHLDGVLFPQRAMHPSHLVTLMEFARRRRWPHDWPAPGARDNLPGTMYLPPPAPSVAPDATKVFPATSMPDPDWWHSLWPDPQGVMALTGVRPGQHVVDICCGDGWFTVPLARLASPGRVEAVDLLPDMLAATERAAQQAGVNNIRPLACDAMTLAPHLEQPAQLAVMANTFHGIPQPTEFCRAVAQALAPGGRLAILNWHARPQEETTVLGKPRGPKTALRLTPEQTRALVEPAGFRQERVEELPPYHYLSVFQRLG
ncbi:MAG: peptide deformylase [Deltaproteobacteria bacterium]|nr:peptide deformylase [Deltaproteobacteria bacterium]